jgi:hypothetical protein
MGYCYDSAGRLVCDYCGTCGGVHKRLCPYVVTDERGHTMHYCKPPALCAACYNKHGGLRGIHGESCRSGSTKSQAAYDEQRARLASGDPIVRSAYGSWHESVPSGMTGLSFEDRDGQALYRLVPATQYHNNGGWLSDFPEATEWVNHPGANSKQAG